VKYQINAITATYEVTVSCDEHYDEACIRDMKVYIDRDIKPDADLQLPEDAILHAIKAELWLVEDGHCICRQCQAEMSKPDYVTNEETSQITAMINQMLKEEFENGRRFNKKEVLAMVRAKITKPLESTQKIETSL
jgi:hypothetical protein